MPRIRLAVALAALGLLAAACLPAPPVGAGKVRFDWWRAIQIVVHYGDLSAIGGTPCDLADPPNWAVYIDPTCIALRGDPPGTSPGTFAVYTDYHVAAHDVDANIFHYMFGDGPLVASNGGVYYQGRERAAQCIGEALLGWTLVPRLAPGVADAIGYWDCPASHVAYARQKLVEAGIA
jgi:hypothetical protein